MRIRIILGYILVVLWTIISPSVSAQSTEIDKEIGKANAETVEKQMGIYNNEEMTQYVRDIGKRLVSHIEDPLFTYSFHIADDPAPNAFALPGGYVYVTRGILTITESEDELACVMGHEIIHVEQRHSVKQLGGSILPRLLEVPGNIVGALIDEDLGTILNAPIKTTNDLTLASYSRGFESEADVMGVNLAARAGYNPLAMNDILTRLNTSVEYLTQRKTQKSYFDDHPYTPDRVSKITEISEDIEPSKLEPISKDFPMPLDGLLFGYNPAQGYFEGQDFFQPELDFKITFPEGWTTKNQPESVSAVNPDLNAGIFLALSDPANTSTDYGKAYVSKLKDEFNNEPTFAGEYVLNGNPGYLVSTIDNTGEEPMYVHLFWVEIGDNSFQLVGLGPQEIEPVLKESAESLHSLTKEEKSGLEKTVMRIKEAQEGETVEELLERLGSNAKPDAIALINGVAVTEKLNEGEKIKVIQMEPY